MTLVELLVVVFIILLVAAVMAPRLQPIMDHGRIREAARSIQLYLSSARNQAMATGRSCGVLIEPLPADNGCSMTLKQVETPLAYGGDMPNSTVMSVSGTVANQYSFPCTLGSAASPPVYAILAIQFSNWPSVPLYPGDQIQVGYQGFWYIVAPSKGSILVPNLNPDIPLNTVNSAGAVGTTPLTIPGGQQIQCIFVYVDVSHGEQPGLLASGTSGAYKVLLWPTKSAAGDLQLPSPTVIDLTWSGHDPVSATDSPTWSLPTTTAPPLIMFAPDGSVDRSYVRSSDGTYNGVMPMTPMYLLVGMRKNIVHNTTANPNAVATNPNANINDFNNLWVSIDPATGLIVVADPAALPATQPPSTTNPITNQDVWNSRAFARQALVNLGGK